jgi:hypothetical protein
MPDKVPIFFQGAVQLAGWAESHNQGCRVTFWLESADDLEAFRLATVRKGKVAGQIFQMVLVEVDPDQGEDPVQHPSNSAHLKITSEEFVRYAKSLAPARDHWDTARVREWTKYVIGVKSLSELDSDPAALERYHRLVRIPFDLWLHRQSGENDGDDDAADRDGLDGE